MKKGVFNIYTYLVDNKKALPLKDDFVYFPLTYFALGGYQAIISPLLGSGFDSWLANAGSNSVVADPGIFKYLAALKFPYLVLDIAIAFLLMRFFENKEDKKKVFTFWLFNPFTIILLYAYSNVDIFPMILTVLAFLMIKKQKLFPASILLGLASGFKLYPLLFIPFLFLAGGNLKEKFILAATPLVTFGLIILPFISGAFFKSALVSGLTTGIFTSNSTTLGLSLLFFYAVLVDKGDQDRKKINLFNYWVALFLIIFSFSLFHIQWLLWVAPFLILIAVKKPNYSWLIFLLGILSFAIPILYMDRYMTVSLFRVYSTWYDLAPTPYTIIQKVYDPYNLLAVLHSVLAAGSLAMVYKVFKEKEVL